MTFLPLNKMWDRVEVARQDADTSLFFDLLYTGEMLTKTVVAGLASSLLDDRERHRYRQLHRLVRVDSLGEWTQVMDEILLGAASQYLRPESRNDQREITQKTGVGEWQYEATWRLHSALKLVEQKPDDLPLKIDLRRWFHGFVALRNATRGHGAPSTDICGKLCADLEESLRVISENLTLLQRPWAFLHRNLSGKYRVTRMASDTTAFDYLKSASTENFQDGVYLFLDGPVQVQLIETNVDAVDFFFPNGGFNGKRFELISYITGSKAEGNASQYLAPAGSLPPSETEGMGILDPQGQCFGNLPPQQVSYVRRPILEDELRGALLDERHPIVTLVGRGGIGKTSLALAVLYETAKRPRFEAIIWFSARDIDLMPEGPKIVKPQVLTEKDIAQEFVRLLEPGEAGSKGFDPTSFFCASLAKSPLGGAILYVFDNFETVRNPTDIFRWIDTHIRLPNKVLITTRHRDFKADYPVEVGGMTEDEASQLISATASDLRIRELITEEYRQSLYHESDGHPYIIKVLLGEVAKSQRLEKVQRIVAGKDEMLEALFERTYAQLSPVAKRIFLTLCSWRSVVPQVALEAVLIRPENEKMDVERAVEELRQSSFIEITVSSEDGMFFLSVPLSAAVFGRRKLEVSPMKTAIQADTTLLQTFGAAQQSDVRHGVQPRVERLFRFLASRFSAQPNDLERYHPMLEFIARKFSPAWLMVASLYEEFGDANNLEKSKEAVRRYLETTPSRGDQEIAWRHLASLCHRTSDGVGEIHALVEMCKLPNTPFSTLSNTANRLNALFREQYLALDSEEKRIVVQNFVHLLESRAGEAEPIDYSRLAWLCLHIHDESKARMYAESGLSLDPHNEHCTRLVRRLEIGKQSTGAD
jgi:hypothetical protein